ncbi:hypothetical protein MBLNU13_g08860t1 [Cladosporium sp. NU13]
MASNDSNKPKFEWDYDVPTDGFWTDLDYRLIKGFLQCYTEPEIAEMKFDETLSTDDKLTFLLKYLDNTLTNMEGKSRLETGLLLRDADNNAWRTILLGLGTIEYFLGHWEAEERYARERCENGPGGEKDMSALQELSIVMERQGKYSEGESMAKSVLDWMDELPKLGRESPQAIASACVLAICVWKQGRHREGGALLDDCTQRVQAMGEGKFAKYQEAERQLVEQTRVALEEWTATHEDGKV